MAQSLETVDKGKLTSSERQRVDSWFRQLGITNCPICGSGDTWWTVGSHMVFLPTYKAQESRSAYPGVVIMCKRCWHINVHHSSVADVKRKLS